MSTSSCCLFLLWLIAQRIKDYTSFEREMATISLKISPFKKLVCNWYQYSSPPSRRIWDYQNTYSSPKKKKNWIKRREFPAQIQITVMYLFFSHILAGYKIFIQVKPRQNTVFFFLSLRFFPGLRSVTGPSPAKQDRAALPVDNWITWKSNVLFTLRWPAKPALPACPTLALNCCLRKHIA